MGEVLDPNSVGKIFLLFFVLVRAFSSCYLVGIPIDIATKYHGKKDCSPSKQDLLLFALPDRPRISEDTE